MFFTVFIVAVLRGYNSNLIDKVAQNIIDMALVSTTRLKSIFDASGRRFGAVWGPI